MPKAEFDPKVFQQRNEVLRSIEPRVGEFIDNILIPRPGERWNILEYLPNRRQPDWRDHELAIKQEAAQLSPGLVVLLAVHQSVEQNLPSYQARLNMIPAMRDETGVDEHAFARGQREWVSQEAPHGQSMTAYLDLSERVDMEVIYLMNDNIKRNGFRMNPRRPYGFFFYTKFQERSTKQTHGQNALMAKKDGAEDLARLLGKITGDEARHERYYNPIIGEIITHDPAGAVIELRDTMVDGIDMPAALADDRVDWKPLGKARFTKLFLRYGKLAISMGIYTPQEYACNFKHLLDKFKIGSLRLDGEAAQAQQELFDLYEEQLRMVDRWEGRQHSVPDPEEFSFMLKAA